MTTKRTADSEKTCCCKVDSDGSVNLNDILNSFKAPMKEEHTWALCYQCIRFFIETQTTNTEPCYLVRVMNDVYLRTDGNVHPKTAYPKDLTDDTKPRPRADNEMEIIFWLGVVLYSTLDHCYKAEEERIITEPLEDLIKVMTSNQVAQSTRLLHEPIDEGIEWDSEDTDMSAAHKKSVAGGENQLTLKEVLQRCEAHVSILTKAQAECHYKAVVRALVTEALELATFLDIVAKGKYLAGSEQCTTRDLDQLQFLDWSSLWLTVISELRMGVKLKKVHYGRAPIEYELTPYEILMKDIRNYKCNLRKVTQKVKTENVRRHGRDIILEFIRSRPPLKKASERKLGPHPPTYYSPREQLLHSIRKGGTLRKTTDNQLQVPSGEDFGSSVPNQRNVHLKLDDEDGTMTKRRLIAVDFSQIDDFDDDDHIDVDDDEDEDEDEDDEDTNLWTDDMMLADGDSRQSRIAGKMVVDKYDLAMASHGARFRHLKHRVTTENGILTVIDQPMGSHSVPQSRPTSRQSCASTSDLDNDTSGPTVTFSGCGPLDQLSLDNRLSLTLEEIVHIRTVLTAAEIEALPVEAQVRANVVNRKVCFLCLKTKFSVFGPWGHRCILCQCTVCSKCSGRMRIPMEHFASVPVVLLSPNIMSTPDNDSLSDDFFPSAGTNSGRSTPDGSACASTAINALSNNRSPSRSRPNSSLDRFKAKTTGASSTASTADRLRAEASGQMMIVCHDCRAMVLQIIKSAQSNRSAIRNKHLQSLTLDLSPMF